MTKKRRVAARGGIVAAAAGTLAAGLGGGSVAAAGPGSEAAATPTIQMEFERGRLQFDGPARVRAGQTLRIRNTTDPRQGGPHTFTLAASRVIPKTRRAQQQCFSPGKVCMDAAIAHRFDPQTERVNRPLVKAGRAGWDARFTSTRTGDSWYTETKGERFSQRVSAKPGTTLRFLCIVHPDMQGEIEVVGRR